MARPEHQTWEYRTTGVLSEVELNELGHDGWELTGIAGDIFYMKRPRLSFREQVTVDQKRRYYALWNATEESSS